MFKLIAVLMITIPLFAAAPVRDVNVLSLPGVNVLSLPGVEITNTPSVEITNVPDVRVVNTIPIPVTMANPGAAFPRTGFSGHANSTFGGPSGVVAVGGFDSPVDSTLVIEMVTTQVWIRNSSSRLEMILLRVENPIGAVSEIYLPVSDTNRPLVFSQLDFNEFHLHNVRIYLEPGSNLTYQLQTSLPNATGTAVLQFDGYLVPVGSPSLSR